MGRPYSYLLTAKLLCCFSTGFHTIFLFFTLGNNFLFAGAKEYFVLFFYHFSAPAEVINWELKQAFRIEIRIIEIKMFLKYKRNMFIFMLALLTLFHTFYILYFTNRSG